MSYGLPYTSALWSPVKTYSHVDYGQTYCQAKNPNREEIWEKQ